MTFYLKGHQKYQKSKLKLPKKSAFIKQIWNYKSLSSGNFDTPGGKLHIVPHLKALNSIFEHSIKNEHGSLFT